MRYPNVIREGNTATVYEWTDGKVLKLFHHNYPADAIKKEFNNAMAISNMEFLKPNAYEIVAFDHRIGITYDHIKGESLQDWTLRTENLGGCAAEMAKLHREILRNKAENIPYYKDLLRSDLLKVAPENPKAYNEALGLLEDLEGGDTLCHGDFHPGNILIDNGEIAVIDFMNICHGPDLYDIARTVYLVEYTPVAVELMKVDGIKEMKKAIADQYLIEMQVTREMISDYIAVITVARKGECPDE